ncbi:unnamed protein product [Auanema sp. JU1783]|nr:unnamed protein product [Auanema sp. JU1783]
MEQQKEQERQQLEIQRIILGHVASVTETEERVSPEINEFDPKKETNDEDTEVKTESSDSVDFGLGTSDEQVRASMIHLLNPVLGSAFGSAQIEETNSRRRSDYSPATKKHRWMTNGELEESRFGRGKNYGRVHCKATYKCALCGKPTTLNSTGSRWNLLRHVIMIHSESKPYQCFDCDFNGIKSNVISHARQSGHRCDDAFDITTDEMRAEWNAMLHACFPDYVKAKTRGWQSEENTPKEASTTENEVEA